MNVLLLHSELEKIAPITGVDSTGKITFASEATQKQKDDAELFLSNWSDPPPTDLVGFLKTIRKSPSFKQWRKDLRINHDAIEDVQDLLAAISVNGSLESAQEIYDELKDNILTPKSTDISEWQAIANSYGVPVVF